MPEASPVPSDWFSRAFRGEYLRVYRRRDDASGETEARFAREALSLVPGERVLDLGCGGGRHTGPLRAGGLEVVGLDLSPELLATARTRPGWKSPLVRADMRALPFRSEAFAAVTSFFTSFGYFLAEGEDARVLAEIARVVVGGGRLLLDLPDREATIAGLVPRSEREVEGRSIRERRWITEDGRRVEKEILVTPGGAEGGGDAEFVPSRMFESVRLYSAEEIELLAERAGWRIARRWGDFDGRPWRSGEGPRLLMHLEREPSRGGSSLPERNR